MSSLLFSGLLLFNVFTQSSESLTYKASRQTSFSGVCCNYNIKYQLEINASKAIIEQVLVDSIIIDENVYSNNWEIHKTDSSITFKFGRSFTKEYQREDKSYEINREIRERIKDRLIYHLNGVRYEIAMKNIETLFPIAYP